MRLFYQLIAVCAVATMFVADASAQRRGGWGRGYGGGYYGGGYYGRGYYGGNFGRGYYSPNYYGGYYGYGNNWNQGYYSNYPSYGYSYPSYSTYTYPSQTYYAQPNTNYYVQPNTNYYTQPNTNYYTGPSTSMYQGNSQAANLRVLVPDPSARVTIQGQEMQATGTQRDFVSPALEAGRAYTYTIVATWNANGQMVTRQKQVDVQPGQNVLVDFNVE